MIRVGVRYDIIFNTNCGRPRGVGLIKPTQWRFIRLVTIMLHCYKKFTLLFTDWLSRKVFKSCRSFFFFIFPIVFFLVELFFDLSRITNETCYPSSSVIFTSVFSQIILITLFASIRFSQHFSIIFSIDFDEIVINNYSTNFEMI